MYLNRLKAFIQMAVEQDDPRIALAVARKTAIYGDKDTPFENRDALVHYMLCEALGFRRRRAAAVLIPLAKANINRTFVWGVDDEPMCYLMLAIRIRQTGCMAALLAAGADPDLEVGEKGSKYHTPRSYARYFAKDNQPYDDGMHRLLNAHRTKLRNLGKPTR